MSLRNVDGMMGLDVQEEAFFNIWTPEVDSYLFSQSPVL